MISDLKFPIMLLSIVYRNIWLRAAEKKGNQGKKERFSKQQLSKGCHQGHNITVLAILEYLEFKTFSCRPTMVTHNTSQYSMTLPL